MRSFVRSVVLALLAASTATALSLEASLQQDGKDVDASSLDFVQIPPVQHNRHPARRRHGHGKGREHGNAERDLISYSSNWCGASQHTSRSDAITNVFGWFTVPDLTLRPGSPAPQFAAAWVGIDGAECNTTLLQAGVTTIVNSNGGQSASAWWEWYPEAAFTIEGLRVRPGDWMSVNITATSQSSGRIVITNTSRGTTVTIHVNNGPKLCRVDAEWIIEDFYDSGEQVAFARFEEMWFVDAGATTASGKNIGIDGATMVHLQDDDGKLLCSAEPWDNTNFVLVSHG